MSDTSRFYRPKLAVPRLSRRRLLQAGGLGTMGMLLAACSDDGDGGSGGGGGGEVLSSITLGINNPNYATQLPIYVADAQGYFEDVGIEEFEVVTTDEYVPGLIGGSLDMTQGDTDVIFGSAEESGSGMLFLGTYRGSEWQIMGVSPDVESPEDLVGGRITGGQRGSRNEYVQRQILVELGLDPDNDVEFVSVGGGSDSRMEALLGGQVQGASVFPRHRAQLEEAGGQFIYEELTINPQEGIAVMSDWLEDNYATVVAYLTANLRARQYLQDLGNRDEIIELMRDSGFEIPEEFVELYEIEIDQLSPDGGFDVADMDALVDLQIELEALPEGMEWRDHVNLEPLWEAQEAAGLDRNPDSI